MAEELQRNAETGARLKALRKGLRLTQPVVAERVGVSLRAYQVWEAGDGGIAWTHLEKLAGVLGATPEFVLHGEVQPMNRASVGTQLDRIEAKLDELLDAVRDADGEAVEAELDDAPLPTGERGASTG